MDMREGISKKTECDHTSRIS